jgi:hypothetical protein
MRLSFACNCSEDSLKSFSRPMRISNMKSWNNFYQINQPVLNYLSILNNVILIIDQ